MSAIFGIVNKNEKPIELGALNIMQSAIAHRATDGKGTLVDGVVGFGHCLLKVYPQQDYEHCPLTAYSCTITADARLDNRSELAVLLGIDSARLITVSDSEIILLSYKHWGEDCVNHLEGEFAFAIWDANNQKLFAATDHIGFRPLFYYDSSEQFIFCSEMKGVVAAKPQPNYFNEESLVEYFYRKGLPNATYNKEVFALCGGNVLTLQDGKMAYRKYWNLESTGKYNFTKDQDWYDCTREMLYRTVEKRLNPDVPTGITLSGGLDSTSVACILSEFLSNKNKPLYTFSSVLPLDHIGVEKDERYYIDLVGRHCPNIIQTYVEASGVGPLTDLEEAFEIEEKFPNPYFYMDKALLNAAADKNIKSLFTGFGGDFWVSWKGDTVIWELLKSWRFFDAITLMNRVRKEEEVSFYQIAKSSSLCYSKTLQKVRKITRLNEIYNVENELLNINPSFSKIIHEGYYNQMQGVVNDGSIGRIVGMLSNRNSCYKCDSLMPLLDKDLLDLLSDMPLELHLKNGKRRSVLREVVKGVAPELIYKRKDKMPYIPDYKKRILNEVDYYREVVESMKNNTVSRQYMNMPNVVELFDIAFHSNSSSKISKTIYNRIAHVAIAHKLLGELSRIGYYFDTTE